MGSYCRLAMTNDTLFNALQSFSSKKIAQAFNKVLSKQQTVQKTTKTRKEKQSKKKKYSCHEMITEVLKSSETALDFIVLCERVSQKYDYLNPSAIKRTLQKMVDSNTLKQISGSSRTRRGKEVKYILI